MFECVVCGRCTRSGRILSTPGGVVAVCGAYCRLKLRREAWKYMPADAELGGAD